MEASNVKVIVRIRPLSSKERLEGSTEAIHVIPSTTQVVLNEHSFTYDNVFEESATQSDLYAQIQPLIFKFVDGYNCSILAYGQTGSGKTYTMGTGLDSLTDEDNHGIVSRAINDIFAKISEAKSTKNNPADASDSCSFTLLVSFIEIYNEEIIDLLSAQDHDKKAILSIREDSNGEIFLSGAREETVASSEDILGYPSLTRQIAEERQSMPFYGQHRHEFGIF